MKVTIIGTGNIATVMGRTLMANGHHIVQVWGRDVMKANSLAHALRANAIDDLNQLAPDADIYIVAVKDQAIAEVASNLRLPDRVIIHTAGAVEKEVLQPVSHHYGVVWPIKMIRKSMPDFGTVTIAIDASDEHTKKILSALVHPISPDFLFADNKQRQKMHLMASLILNFTNHLLVLADEFGKEEGIDVKIFHGMIADMIKLLQDHPPSSLQAGPAYRGDWSTVQKHLTLLNRFPELQELYETISKHIYNKYNK